MKANNKEVRSVGPQTGTAHPPRSLGRRRSALTLCLSLSLSLSLLSACGQKGPLHQPKPTAGKAAAPAASAARP
ncbi:LPS translocon maturation chaperone LptM [Paucibacter sp. DJ2R-2]|uniref:LPS translocon maturation chaperone LptM n=1 Tax=Paucibacter sp. DJ2R-2 TaxID=2893558 RepID=UPI00398CDBB1